MVCRLMVVKIKNFPAEIVSFVNGAVMNGAEYAGRE